MKTRRIAVFIALGAFLLLQALTPAENLDWFNGTWTGTGDQRSAGKSTWTIKITFDAAKKSGQVEYPSRSAIGSWEVKEGTNQRGVFQENITKGEKICTQGCTVVVTKVSATSVKAAFFMSGDNVNDASKTVTSLILTKT